MSLTTFDSNNVFYKDTIGNVRSAQEDSHGVAQTPNGDLFVVCDGMGGHVGGKQASSIAVNSIIEHLSKQRYPNPQQALNDALQLANMQIIGYSSQHPELRGMGTTACIVLLQDTEAYIAHVGDSRIYLFLGKEKQLHRITKDHSYVQTLVDSGQITDEEAEQHPQKNRILKALGIKPELSPTFNSLKPKNDDVFLICSDGLSGMVNDKTIERVLSSGNSIARSGEDLIDLALEAGGVDNITVELIKVTNSPHRKSDFQSFNPGAKKRKRKESNHEKTDSSDEDTTQSNNSSALRVIKTILIGLVACAIIGYGIYFVGKKVGASTKQSEIERLTAEIERDSTTYIKAKQRFDRIDKEYREAKSQAKQKDTGTYSKAKQKEDSLATALESAKTNMDEANDELLQNKQRRDSLIKINTK